MYLYLYKNEAINIKSQLEPGREKQSDFSERMVKKALRDYAPRKGIANTEEELKSLIILRDEKGKPYFAFSDLAGRQSEKFPIHYSVSHSGSFWGCLMAQEPVGFDMEEFRDKVNHIKIAKRYFTEEEYQYILKMGLEGFFDIWVSKEAYVKFLGLGLSKGLDSFSVIKDGKLSPFVRMLKNEDEPEAQLSRIETYSIQHGVKAAHCSGSGKAIESILTIV